MAALNYNEKKVQKDNALCLHAANYLSEARAMNFHQKLVGFERLIALNERATTKTLHVSLNFDPSEKLSHEKLIAIADDYMKRIGFGRQPFLVYQHLDAGHPHIHIVSTTIQSDGSRINTHNIGRNQSEKARKEIELQYRLVKADRQSRQSLSAIRPVNVDKVVYGQSETKQAITNVVTAVFNDYRFTSFPEFNAALRQYNVVADKGKEGGRISRKGGLVYRVLDGNGNKIGVPIKASSISCRPTLHNLENKFLSNQVPKENLQSFLRAKLDECLSQRPASIQELLKLLQQKQVYAVLRANAQGRVYGITFVDNALKLVCKGSDLGKGYSVMGLQARIGNQHNEAPQLLNSSTRLSMPTVEKSAVQKEVEKSMPLTQKLPGTMDTLLAAKENYENLSGPLLKKKRRRKKRKPDT